MNKDYNKLFEFIPVNSIPHYLPFDGLKNILLSGTLRLTECSYLDNKKKNFKKPNQF